MKLHITKIVTGIFLLSFYYLSAQSTVFKSLSMTSSLLKKEIKFSIYLPNSYQNSQKKYPAIYLLNGFTGNELDWLSKGNVKVVSDSLSLSKKIVESIIIMPDGDDRLYMNNNVDSYPYEDMFINEFIPFIDKTYRTDTSKKNRAISGLSMGGSGALRLALIYPELFGACAAFSSGIFTDEQVENMDQKFYNNYFGRLSSKMIGLKNSERITKEYSDYNILSLLNTTKADLKNTNLYFDCGDDDFLTIGNALLHIELTKMKIPHEFRMRDGKHDWEYWNKSISYGLQFISNSFKN